jgi:hypothetical protein
VGATTTRRVLALLVLATVTVAACRADDRAPPVADPTTTAAPTTTAPGADVASPSEVEGPIEGGRYGVPYNPMPESFADQYGYTEEEWFVSGEATAYAPVGALAPDGRWAVRPADTAPYTTRLLVRRPAEAGDFNGTVVVEWLNDSAGRNSDPQFGTLYPVLLGEGSVYVGVSAQAAGIQGGGIVIDVPGVPAEALAPLKVWDPVRYGGQSHPGDDWSYDIYSQVAQLLRRPGEVDPLRGLPVDRVLAMGESQSAGRLAAYVNAVHPRDRIYDGFLVHSRGDGTSTLGEGDPTPQPAFLRTDLDEPVLQCETETDLVSLGFLDARQPDDDSVVTWEVAGSAHADASFLGYGRASGQVWLPGADNDPTESCGRINDGPQPQVLRAAFVALHDWVADGTPPPTGLPIETRGGDIVRDADGNAVGGIRTPAVDVPVSALTGITPAESIFCLLFGASEPLSAARLADLYVDHEDYVAQVTASADAAVEAGFLLPEDRDAYVAAAETAAVP